MSSKPTVLANDVSRDAFSACASAGGVLVIPVGSTEQHGPHLPIGTDSLIVTHVAEASARRAAERIPVLVAPTVSFGCSIYHIPFGGTLSLESRVLYDVLIGLGTTAVRCGMRRLFFLNGHGGNSDVVPLAARDLAYGVDVDAASGSYWELAWDSLVGVGATSEGRLPGHAGAFETAVILALRPELVAGERPTHETWAPSDPARFRVPYRAELHRSWLEIDGYTDQPQAGVAADGERYVTATVSAVGDALVDFHQRCTAASDPSAP